MLNDKAFVVLIRILAIASFATSVFACFASHHNVSINEHPYAEHVFDIQCKDLTGESQDYCENSINTRHYTLWRVFDNFFSLQDWDGGVLCGYREFHLPITNGDIAELTVGNLGDCTEAQASVLQAFTVLSCLFASLLALYITIPEDEVIVQSKLAQYYHSGMILLMAGSLSCSAIAIAVYKTLIDPLRLDATFCQRQELFDYCDESTGNGFWYQVATLVMSLVALVLSLAWKALGSPPGVATRSTPAKPEIAPQQAHAPFYKSLHFYVHLVRFLELAILIIGIMSTFTRIQTAIPPSSSAEIIHPFDGLGVEMDTEINLWQGLFCHRFGARLFLWAAVLDVMGVKEAQESFGECETSHLFHCQLGYGMVLVTAILGTTFQKDPKTMPLAYIIGFIMHFLSMLKLSMAIGIFMTSVYPGRSSIDPSYCSLFGTHLQKAPPAP